MRRIKHPGNSFIIGASGTLNWRKAPEIFLHIARETFRAKPDSDIFFVWIGGAAKESYELFKVNYEIEKSGIKNRVFFLEHKSNPLD